MPLKECIYRGHKDRVNAARLDLLADHGREPLTTLLLALLPADRDAAQQQRLGAK